MAMRAKKSTPKAEKAKLDRKINGQLNDASIDKKVANNKNAVTVKPKEQSPAPEDKIEAHRYYISSEWGVKWIINHEDGSTKRRVREIAVYADDKAAYNNPETRTRLLNNAKAELVNEGFFLSDDDARDDAVKLIEGLLDALCHELVYGEICPSCLECTLKMLVSSLRTIRSFANHKRASLAASVMYFQVLPDNFTSEWYIDGDGYAIRKNPPPLESHLTRVKSAKELPEDVRKSLASLLSSTLPPAKAKEAAEKLGLKLPAKDAPKLCQQEKKALPAAKK